MNSELTYWHSTLQGKSLPIHENDPQEGWFRTRPRRGYRSLAVRIWRDAGSGELLALRDGKRVDPFEVWTWCCMNPVSVEAYEDVTERGEPWPDEIGLGQTNGAGRQERVVASGRRPLRSAAARVNAGLTDRGRCVNRVVSDGVLEPNGVRTAADLSDGRSAGIGKVSGIGENGADGSASDYGKPGHNSRVGLTRGEIGNDVVQPGLANRHADASEALTDEIALLWNEVGEWLERLGVITDQISADRCANFADAFASFEKQAEELRVVAKKPVLDESRRIDAQWKPIVSAADEAKRICKKALEPFLIAETARIEQDATLLGRPVESAKAGTFGRTISLRRVKRVRVSDRSAFLAHYHRDPRLFSDETVQKLLLKLAEIDLQAGQSVAGAEIIEEQVAA